MEGIPSSISLLLKLLSTFKTFHTLVFLLQLQSSWKCKELSYFVRTSPLLGCAWSFMWHQSWLAYCLQRFSFSCSWPHVGSAQAEGWGPEVRRRGICFNFLFSCMLVGTLFVSFSYFEAKSFLCPCASSAPILSDSLLLCIVRLENVCVCLCFFYGLQWWKPQQHRFDMCFISPGLHLWHHPTQHYA